MVNITIVPGSDNSLLITLDPMLGYFCISNHNLILNSYGDTHHSSWTKRTSFVTQMSSRTTKRRTTLAGSVAAFVISYTGILFKDKGLRFLS